MVSFVLECALKAWPV